MDLVSVVTPTYMRESELLRCAASVAAQTYERIEHVIVGDRCPVLRDLEPRLRDIGPVRTVHLPDWEHPASAYTTGRIARARNAGVAVSDGALVAHVDSDNTIDPDHVEALAAVLEDPWLGVAHSYRRLLYADGRPYLEPLHPWAADRERAAAIYARYAELGIYTPGTNLMSDDLVLSGVDASELMARREVHRRYPFATVYSAEQMARDLGEDQNFGWEIRMAGIGFASSRRHSLAFRLGGHFTTSH